MRFPAQLYLKIQLPRQTYFCLQVSRVRARFTPFHYGRDDVLGGISIQSIIDVNYFTFYSVVPSSLLLFTNNSGSDAKIVQIFDLAIIDCGNLIILKKHLSKLSYKKIFLNYFFVFQKIFLRYILIV